MICDIKRMARSEGIWEQGSEENMWTKEERNKWLEKTVQWGASQLVLFTNYNGNYQVMKDETARVSSMHGVEEKCIQGFGEKAGRKETSRKSWRGWEDNIKLILEKKNGAVWTGFFWVRIRTRGGLFCEQ